MRKSTIKPLRLASTDDLWREMEATIEESVDNVCAGGNQQLVESFLFLVDLLTNSGYSESDRANAAAHCQKIAFRYTTAVDQAQDAYLNRINPGRAQLARTA